jgi:hypothetical protein
VESVVAGGDLPTRVAARSSAARAASDSSSASRQAAHRRRVGVRSSAPLEIRDTARAHRRALGEGLLGEPGATRQRRRTSPKPGCCPEPPPAIGLVPQTASD